MRGVGRGVRATAVAAAAVVGLVAASAAPAGAELSPRQERFASRLVRAVDVGGANRHLRAFQRIADLNGGNRASGLPGYDASVDYVAGLLDDAGFIVERQAFSFPFYQEVSSSLAQLEPDAVDYVEGQDYTLLEYSGSGDVEAEVVAVDIVLDPPRAPVTSGCEAEDFEGFPRGAIALIQRGTCTFELKVQNAVAAGAVGVVIFNQGNTPEREVLLENVTLGAPAAVPVVGVSFATGAAFAAATPGLVLALAAEVDAEDRVVENVIAQTRSGRTDNVVMAGAHLDSVQEGPGINDNGTGSAALLETALELGSSPRVNNAVRFAWWGAEESGLLGAEYYVGQLGFEDQVDIALYLNFDMVGSPNAGYFVYDGDDSDDEGAGAGPIGSASIEATFVDFLLDYRDVETEGTDFDGRSDYGPFILAGIPSGGLFTGAEGIKTPEQAEKWGGTAGIAYDPCYHQACDTLLNVDRRALDRNLDAIAWAVGVYAISTEEVNGESPRWQREAARVAASSQRTASVETITDEVDEAA